jgi:hypothetical protein
MMALPTIPCRPMTSGYRFQPCARVYPEKGGLPR